MLREASPKCGGQYLQDGTECQCHQCPFEWGLFEPEARVMARVRHYAQGDPAERTVQVTPAEEEERERAQGWPEGPARQSGGHA